MSLTRFMGGWDIHGDECDPAAVKVFHEFAKIWKPTIRICGGDLWNFAAFRRGAHEEEQRQSIKEDLETGYEWFNKFKPTHFLRGNHDERLWELAESDRGPISDYAAQGVAEIEAMVKKYKCRMLPYHKRDGILKLGHLKALHGFHCGVYAARQTALVYGSALFGHTHTIDEHAIPGLERRVARNVGCLCKLDMDYNARTPNALRQAHGFPYGILDTRTGNYQVWQAEEVGGKWILPTDYVTL